MNGAEVILRKAVPVLAVRTDPGVGERSRQ
jgi:hypothetical protein